MFAPSMRTRELQVPGHLLDRSITPLVSFSGDIVQPIGSIHLPISFGSAPRLTTVTTLFLIVDCPTAYNVILGRLALAHMKVFISTHMLLLKFPTPHGTGTVRGDQLGAHSCYASAVKSTNRQHKGEALAEESITQQVEPVEDLELVTLYDDIPDWHLPFTRASLSINPAVLPVRQKHRAYDPERYEAMNAEVDKLSSIGFIKEVDYPTWLANMLVDVTVGHALLSFMDAYSGYNQIFMHPEDQAHSSFITDHGLYSYKVMPFNLKNVGATYQHLVNSIFAPLIGNTIEVYVDDMLVKSRTADQHIPNLSAMFTILKQYRMRLNPTKCAFGVASGKFLGFMISQ
ncbi:unnamed protein product, partial [Prunus brigantina]